MVDLFELIEEPSLEKTKNTTPGKLERALRSVFTKKNTTPVKQFEYKGGEWQPIEGKHFLKRLSIYPLYIRLQTEVLVRDAIEEYDKLYFEDKHLEMQTLADIKDPKKIRGVVITTKKDHHLYIRCV